MPTAWYKRRLFGVNQCTVHENPHLAKSQKPHIMSENSRGCTVTVPRALQGPTEASQRGGGKGAGSGAVPAGFIPSYGSALPAVAELSPAAAAAGALPVLHWSPAAELPQRCRRTPWRAHKPLQSGDSTNNPGSSMCLLNRGHVAASFWN